MNKANSDVLLNKIIVDNKGLYDNLENMNDHLSKDDINIALLSKLYYSINQIRMILGISTKRIIETKAKIKVLEITHV